MPREWLLLTRNSEFAAKPGPLADPLERDEWRGLDFILPLLARFVRPAVLRRQARRGDHHPAALPILRPVRRS